MQEKDKLKVGNSLIGARFKKNANGFYPWLMLDNGMMEFGNRLKDYSIEAFERAKVRRKKFLATQLDSLDERLKDDNNLDDERYNELRSRNKSFLTLNMPLRISDTV